MSRKVPHFPVAGFPLQGLLVDLESRQVNVELPQPDLHLGFYSEMLPVDEKGFPVARTRMSHPYNYDSHMVWRGAPNEEADDGVYTDRLLQWDFSKHDELCLKHFGNKGQVWRKRTPEKIEAFLRDWCEDPRLKLVFVMECCNQSSGYPLWYLAFKRGSKQGKTETLVEQTEGRDGVS